MHKWLILCAILLAYPAAGETSAQPPATQPAQGYGAPIRLEEALALIRRAMDLATAQQLKLAVAVVEPTGELVAFARMNDVAYGAVTLAQQKARTSARFRMTTANGEEQVQNGRSPLLSAEDFVTIGGGAPIIVDSRIIGAIGVSGASAKQDAAIASLTVTPK